LNSRLAPKSSPANAPREWLGLHAGDFSIPSTLPQRESWGTGMRGNPAGTIGLNGGPAAPLNFNSSLAPGIPAPGVLDAPDTGLRTIILKQAAGQPLNDRDFRRLATRQGVENQQPAMNPANGIEALMGRTARPLLDSSRPADTAVDRLLRQSQTQGAIEDRAAQTELRRNNLKADQQKAAFAADQQARHNALLQTNPNPSRADLAKAGITDEGLLKQYDTVPKGPAPEAGTTHEVPGIGQIVSMGNGNFQLVKPPEAPAPTQFSRLLQERAQLAADPNHNPADLAALDKYIAKETMRVDAFGNEVTPGGKPAVPSPRGAGGAISMAPSAPTTTGLPTATNPQTGEKLVFQDGKWQPLK
jgi:hypothetical protein